MPTKISRRVGPTVIVKRMQIDLEDIGESIYFKCICGAEVEVRSEAGIDYNCCPRCRECDREYYFDINVNMKITYTRVENEADLERDDEERRRERRREQEEQQRRTYPVPRNQTITNPEAEAETELREGLKRARENPNQTHLETFIDSGGH